MRRGLGARGWSQPLCKEVSVLSNTGLHSAERVVGKCFCYFRLEARLATDDGRAKAGAVAAHGNCFVSREGVAG